MAGFEIPSTSAWYQDYSDLFSGICSLSAWYQDYSDLFSGICSF
jgi:hypothetical protein